jgi:hypothetical protein
MIYFCCDERRRIEVGKHPTLRGIDFLEVAADQQRLFVHFVPAAEGVVKSAVPQGLTAANIKITGGERITGVRVLPIHYEDDVLVVPVDDDENPANGVGDFSPYRFHLVDVPNFDPLLSAADFSFKVECLSEFDCKEKRVCPSAPLPRPEIDYLAKDYASFRRLMLDRMALLMPQWKERNAADLGVALVELLAYVGDHLSYQQDAVATEAYLGTARSRISARRHARLVDYYMHDGCNARAGVHAQVSADITLPKRTPLFTRIPGFGAGIPRNSPAYDQALAQKPEVFETMHDSALRAAHNEIYFYTWGDEDCCLPKGATRATLKQENSGGSIQLAPGDVLIFEEVRGSQSGNLADADPAHRHAVRLTAVTPTADQLFAEGNPSQPIPVFDIEWGPEDALPVPFCLREVPDSGNPAIKHPVSVARGNIVLADHGRTVQQKFDPAPSPNSRLVRVPAQTPGCCEEAAEIEKQRERLQVWPRFRPWLQERPLTQAGTILKIKTGNKEKERLPFDPEAPAAAAFRWEWKDVLPAITLNDNDKTWNPQRDLLAGDKFDTGFVVEVENDGTAFLRFGDDRHGARPNPGTKFEATYRVGNGVAGNVGAEAIAHIVTSESGIVNVRNPLPARGGVDPESIEEVRLRAPFAFRTLERAVTPEDYAEVTERDSRVQKAAATFRWTGSWHTVFLTVDRKGGEPADTDFEKKTRAHVERYRMAGYDLEVDGPRYVSLEIDMHVCVKPDYFRSDVKAALLEVFSNRDLPDGRRGVFHPDNFTFGQPVYRSPLYAAAQAVPGVASVHITKFQRQDTPGTDSEALDKGNLTLGRLEIARLDNDRNFPEHGVLRVTLGGGK